MGRLRQLYRATATSCGLGGRLAWTAFLLGVPAYMLWKANFPFIVALCAWIIVAPRFLRDVWRPAPPDLDAVALQRRLQEPAPADPSDLIDARPGRQRW